MRRPIAVPFVVEDAIFKLVDRTVWRAADRAVDVVLSGASRWEQFRHPKFNRPFVVISLGRSRGRANRRTGRWYQDGVSFVAGIRLRATPFGPDASRMPLSTTPGWKYIWNEYPGPSVIARVDPWPRRDGERRMVNLAPEDLGYMRVRLANSLRRLWVGTSNWLGADKLCEIAEMRWQIIEEAEGITVKHGVPWESVHPVLSEFELPLIGLTAHPGHRVANLGFPEATALEALIAIRESIEQGGGADEWRTALSSRGFSRRNEETIAATA